jgi:hypothetical protein
MGRVAGGYELIAVISWQDACSLFLASILPVNDGLPYCLSGACDWLA